MRSKKIWSEFDSRGHLNVDCSECDRGGNGYDKDKCSCGHKIKRGGRGSCFSGSLMQGIKAEMISKHRAIFNAE